MELPNAVYVGDHSIGRLGELLRSQELRGPFCVASGPHVRRLLGEELIKGMSDLELVWVEVASPTDDAARGVEMAARNIGAHTVVGFGGGKTIDVAKVAAQSLKSPMVSVPTSASHDGISSPFASLRGSEKPYSRVTKPPFMIVVDLDIISRAPPRLLKGGFGDMIAKLTAVRDWELARDDKGEYFGDYSASLAKMSAQHVMDRASEIGSVEPQGVRALVEALISSGVAAGIAGSSRPCSGSEHLISHALEVIAPGVGLHGEKTGLATVMMAELHGLDWRGVRKALESSGCPLSYRQIGLSEDQVIEAVLMAPSIRPERYTILHKLGLKKDEVRELARRTEVVV
jgi:glycerol-1-phosphate dehydrogenase [NAD(P)+]